MGADRQETTSRDGQPYFYDAWKAELYDARTDSYWRDRDLDFYLGLAQECGGPILELACGTGRVTLPLARSGHEVVGVDLSPHMLEMARRKLVLQAPEVQARVTFLGGDLSDFALDRQFALILIPFRSFQFLLTREDQRRCLEACARHLQPEGRLVLDVFNARLARLVAGGEDLTNEFAGPDGSLLRQGGRAEFDTAEQMLHDWTWTERVKPEGAERLGQEELRLRYFFRFEVEWMLEACGFEIEALYGNFDRSVFTAESPEIIPVARRA